MKIETGRVETGPAGTATELIMSGTPDRPDWAATVRTWFLECPGQSPAWSSYLLGVVHLRPVDGAPAAVVKVPGATHEVILYGLDPTRNPQPTDHETWKPLIPLNVVEQIELPDDDAAVELAHLAAQAVVAGRLPAEPPLAGATEPWHTSLIRTSAHLRGEEHAP